MCLSFKSNFYCIYLITIKCLRYPKASNCHGNGLCPLPALLVRHQLQPIWYQGAPLSVIIQTSHPCRNSETLQDIALSAVFLSAKLEETKVRIRDIVNVFDYLFKRVDHEIDNLHGTKSRTDLSDQAPPFKYAPLEYLGLDYYDYRDAVIIGEAHILKRY